MLDGLCSLMVGGTSIKFHDFDHLPLRMCRTYCSESSRDYVIKEGPGVSYDGTKWRVPVSDDHALTLSYTKTYFVGVTSALIFTIGY